MTSRTRQGEGVRPKASQSNNKKKLHLKSEGDAKQVDERDKGERIAQAVQAELSVNIDTNGTSPEHTYRDPAPLKWKIFEAAAKTNGQRAFAAYWSALRDFMRGWLPRGDLDEAVTASLGEENVHLHNEFVLCLLNNARCRQLPAELISQVPASYRSRVRHAPVDDVALSSSSSSTHVPLSTTNASLPFHGKRKEGLLESEYVSSSAGAGMGCSLRPTAATDGVRGPGSASAASAAGARSDGGASKKVFLKMEGGSGVATAGGLFQRSAAGGQPWSMLRPPPGAAAAGAGAGAGVKLEERGERGGSSREYPLLGGGGGGAACNRSAVGSATPKADVGLMAEERRRSSARGTVEGGGIGSRVAEGVASDQLLDEIDSHFGAGAELWHPWAGAGTGVGAGGGDPGSRKRPALSGLMDGDGTRHVKAAKVEDGAAAGAGFANGNTGGETSYRNFRETATTAAAEKAAEQLAPSYRSQRVPGARALAPLLQAVTASQHMKVSHEVCRVMTASVKEYLRRIIEACLVDARAENSAGGARPMVGSPSTVGGVGRSRSAAQRASATGRVAGSPVSAAGVLARQGGVDGLCAMDGGQTEGRTVSRGLKGHTSTANGTVTASPTGTNCSAMGVSPTTATAPTDDGNSRSSPSKDGAPWSPPRRRIVTPGHLRAALEVTPRLAGPPSSARIQWRRAAAYAGDHESRTASRSGHGL